MGEIDNGPVVVTGEERRHPAIRMLARACIAIARLRLERAAEQAEPAESEDGDQTVEGKYA